MIFNFERPAMPYAYESLPNSNRYQVLTRALNAPPLDIMIDSDYNYLIYAVRALDQALQSLVAGSIPGSDVIGNKDMVLSTDGEGATPWKLITGVNVQDSSLPGYKIQPSSITALQLENGGIPGGKIAPNAITTSHIRDLNITTAKINNLAVTDEKLALLAVGAPNLKVDAVTTEKIVDENVTFDKLAQDVKDYINNAVEDISTSVDALIPIGLWMGYSGSADMSANWTECAGQTLLIANYPLYFAAVGTSYGGDGVTTVGVPDFRGRVPVGLDTNGSTGDRITAATAANIVLGQTGVFGSETHTLTTPEIPAHTHQVRTLSPGSGNIAPGGSNYTYPDQGSGSTGGDLPHNNTQPSIFTRYYIRVI